MEWSPCKIILIKLNFITMIKNTIVTTAKAIKDQ